MKNQRKDGRFQKWVTIGKKPDGKPIRRIVYADTAEELEQKAAELKKDAALGKVGAGTPTFFSMSQAWLKELSKKKSKSTINGYRSYLNRFLLPEVGDKSIAEVTAEDIRKALTKAEDANYSHSTIMQIKSVAVRIGQFAQENDVIMMSGWQDILLKDERKKDEQRILTEEEISLIVTKKEGHAMCLPVLIMLYCGLKGTEIRSLEWEDICLKKRTIRVNKALANCKFFPEITPQRERIIPIPEQLFEHLKKQTFGKGLLCSNAKGDPMTNGELQTAWTSYCRFLYRQYDGRTAKEREHISKQVFFTTQNVRMTYAKMLFESGLNILEVQYLLGHTSLEATFKLAERFLRVDEEKIQIVGDGLTYY